MPKSQSTNFRDELATVTNAWSKKDWLAKKAKLSDCIWIEGAILESEDTETIWIAPAPTSYGLYYEIALSDVVEILPIERELTFLDKTYRLARIYVKKKAVVVRSTWMLASELPEEVEAVALLSKSYEAKVAAGSLVDERITRMLVLGEEPGSGGGGKGSKESGGEKGGGEKGGGDKGGGDKGERERPGPTPRPDRPAGASGVRG